MNDKKCSIVRFVAKSFDNSALMNKIIDVLNSEIPWYFVT